MLRVQNQAKHVVTSGLPLAVVVAMGDLQVTLSPDQNKIHHTPNRVQGTSREPVTEWKAQI
jgi:hypothetical protein